MQSRPLLISMGILALLILPGWLLFYQGDPFVSFQLELNSAGSVLVQWQTRTPNARYELQRSGDVQKWEIIQHFPQQLATQLNWMDTKPFKGINHYRITMIAANSDTFYSSIESIEIMNTADCYLWPQPAKEILHVEVPFTYGTLEIIDASGRTSVKQSLTGYRSEVPIVQLPNGMYFARIKYGNKVWLQRFIKQ